jgi:hypothetical protein
MVHAFGAGSPAADVKRSTPLQRPCAVSNRKIASMAAVPARVTRRGGVRSGSTSKPDGFAWAAPDARLATTASRLSTVPMVQVRARRSRQ